MQANSDPTLSVLDRQLAWSSRMILKLEAFLVVLAIAGMAFEGVGAEDRTAIQTGILFYAAVIIALRYAGRLVPGSIRTIEIEAWGMIAFLTWTIWFTDKLASPLQNAYILVVVVSALTLSMRSVLLQVAAIALCLVLLNDTYEFELLFSVPYASSLLTQVTPLLVVAYVTAMFSSDIRYSMNRGDLRSSIDALTGLYDLRGFAIAADRLFHHAVRHGSEVSILVIGIDELKHPQDSRGSEKANALLRSVAGRARKELRHNDVLARYEQDGFVVLLPETSSSGALRLADRLRVAVNSSPLEPEGEQRKASLSIGHASFARDGAGLDTLVDRARRAMQIASESGGNTVATCAD